jgi:hypothetical protein
LLLLCEFYFNRPDSAQFDSSTTSWPLTAIAAALGLTPQVNSVDELLSVL